MANRAWIVTSLVGPTALASISGGFAELGDGAHGDATHPSWLGHALTSVTGWGLIAVGAASLIYVLAIAATGEPAPRGTTTTGPSPALPGARAVARHGGDRPAGEHVFPSWLAPLLIAAAAIGVDRVAAHVT